MIKEREPVLEKLSVANQAMLSFLSYFGALTLSKWFMNQPLTFTKEEKLLGIMILPLWFLLLEAVSLGRMLRASGYLTIFRNYLTITIIGTTILYLPVYLLPLDTVSTDELVLFAVISNFVLYLFKISLFTFFRYIRRKGYNFRMLLIVADQYSEEVIRQIAETRDWGYRICGIITDDENIIDRYEDDFTILSPEINLDHYLVSQTVDEVLYCKGENNRQEVQHLLDACREIGVAFYLQSDLKTFKELNMHVTMRNRQPLFAYRNIPENYFLLKVKQAFDFVFSFVVAAVLSPLFLLIAVAIKFDDNGPVFFSQERVGLNGRRFQCLKFRTMVVEAEAMKVQLAGRNEQQGPVFKIKNDPRVTRVGAFLRKTSLDELPQFFNVLRGDMSVVGPRPPIPSEVVQYQRWQNRRLSMKPGITCIWQVSGRNNIPFEQWMKMDLEYIDNWSLGLDLQLILKTIKTIFRGSGQ
jgi:exopolysaccharide biosynthesis polyprenyl glycosylphosphotransferase